MKSVTVYTSEDCPYCAMIKMFLTTNGIPFTEVDVEKEPDVMLELISKTGQFGVPQTEVDGNFIVGYNPNGIMQVINM